MNEDRDEDAYEEEDERVDEREKDSTYLDRPLGKQEQRSTRRLARRPGRP